MQVLCRRDELEEGIRHRSKALRWTSWPLWILLLNALIASSLLDLHVELSNEC